MDPLVPDSPLPAGVRAVFTTRSGGVSGGPFASLNLGTHVGDVPAAVAENRRRARSGLALPSEPVWLRQVHGTRVIDLNRLDLSRIDPASGLPSEPPEADAAVSRRPGAVCCVQVADCLPVLLASEDGRAVGAAHAGWRGLAGGVLEATVSALGVPPATITAWLGPAIGPAAFEVGGEVREAFLAQDPAAAAAFVPNPAGRWQCDLYQLARQRLRRAGLTAIHGGGECTVSTPGRYFSYRRDGQCGRMAALIWLEP